MSRCIRSITNKCTEPSRFSVCCWCCFLRGWPGLEQYAPVHSITRAGISYIGHDLQGTLRAQEARQILSASRMPYSSHRQFISPSQEPVLYICESRDIDPVRVSICGVIWSIFSELALLGRSLALVLSNFPFFLSLHVCFALSLLAFPLTSPFAEISRSELPHIHIQGYLYPRVIPQE